MKQTYINKKKHRTLWGTGRLAAYTAAGFLMVSAFAQPMTVLAGPAGSSSGTATSSGGPAGGPGSGSSSHSSHSGSSSSASVNAGYGVSAVTGGLGFYRADSKASGAIARGIDTSYWNQNINWNQVASDNVQFAMLATRFRGEIDPFFRINADAASKAGIKLGAYIYSYAATVQEAEQEADFVLSLIKDYPISFPVVFDAEDANTIGSLSPSEVSNVINAFCRKVEAAGYYPMVYANEYWISNKIDMSQLHYDIWVARYADSFTYSNPAMWQASNTGSVSGVNGNVDINYLYKDFTAVIPANTWRTLGGLRYYYKDHVMQKSAWIHDGQHYYYMNSDGNPLTGWQDIGGSRYCLDASDGHMNTGWQTLNGSWYYLDPSSGAMTTGWQTVDNARYYLGSDGRMMTGWQDIDGIRYYLDGSGAMALGWRDLDGGRYYFDASGAMTSGWQAVDGAWYYLGSDGRMTTGWQLVGGTYYYMNESGIMQTGWVDVNGSRYYLDGSGAMQTGWLDVNGVKYYLDLASGALAVNTVLEQDGIRYQAGADGACTVIPAEETDGVSETAVQNSQPQQVSPAGPAG